MKTICDYIGENAYKYIQKNGTIRESNRGFGFEFEISDEAGRLLNVRKDMKSDLTWDYDILVSLGNDECRNGFRRL
jgi:hypothetical protein